MAVKVPYVVRVPYYLLLGAVTGATLHEAELPLREYRSVGELFTRRLQPYARRIETNDATALVSPCDATVCAVGTAAGGTARLPQIKRASFSLRSLLGMNPPEKQFRYVVLYLAPGDYHRFHAPTNMTQVSVRRIKGEALSVNPHLLKFLDNVLSVNERVVIEATWGDDDTKRLWFVAVGAQGVCKIVLEKDEEQSNVCYKHGDPLGYFAMGSTVVLVVEDDGRTPEWKLKPGQKIQMGERITL